jgi:hypothetical protein
MKPGEVFNFQTQTMSVFCQKVVLRRQHFGFPNLEAFASAYVDSMWLGKKMGQHI